MNQPQEVVTSGRKKLPNDECWDTFCDVFDPTPQSWRNCYLKSSKIHHPDKGGAKEMFQKLSQCNEFHNVRSEPILPHTELPHTELPHTELPHTELPQTELPQTELPQTE